MEPRNLWGTVDMLILDVVSRAPTYGYRIAQAVTTRSHGYFDLKEGSLYPALHRLERAGWLNAYWEDTAEGRRCKYYRLTPAGRSELQRRRDDWKRFAAGVDRVLDPSPAGEPVSRALHTSSGPIAPALPGAAL